ncbi:hypothetical protein ES332_D12G079400v1 [Gossypium tomentosum]|uniref:Uncharacterized protein n=1 Tax=Gossypium tomentosum TaxID=34277 RepID=A0A5D2I6Q2_GOSTO|nr:hypothetical protein ES332_D12G079400v1 [Gossypium tomentosum]
MSSLSCILAKAFFIFVLKLSFFLLPINHREPPSFGSSPSLLFYFFYCCVLINTSPPPYHPHHHVPPITTIPPRNHLVLPLFTIFHFALPFLYIISLFSLFSFLFISFLFF